MNKKNKKRHLDYKEYLLTKLQDPEEAEAYLNAAILEDDKAIFLLALKDVIEAREKLSHIANKAELNRENLYRLLSKKREPKI